MEEESAPKPSQSGEKLVNEKDISLSSSCDSGLHCANDNLPILSETDNKNISNQSDSGLGCKMKDSLCGDDSGDVLGKGENAPEKVLKKIDADGDKEEKIAVEEKEDMDINIVDTSVEEPCSSSSLINIKRSKRNRSRNYRTAGRSASSSSIASSTSSTSSATESASKTAKLSSTSVPGQSRDDMSVEGVENTADGTSSSNSNRTFSIDSSPILQAGNAGGLFRNGSNPVTSTDSDDDDDQNDDDDDADTDYASPGSADSARLNKKDEEFKKLMEKPKPLYTWNAAYELMRREHGLSGDGKVSLQNGFSNGFNHRFYASRHIIERMQLSHVLRRHNGCVNSLNFNKTGDFLVTGSDDARLIVWDWAGNKIKHVWKSGHCANIFQSKFVTTSSCLDIISAARDGRVRRSIVPSAGGKVQTSNLYNHRGPVHKLVLCPDNPWEIISVGEDGFICSKDLREENNKIDLLQVMTTSKISRKVRLFSISHHPFAPEICVSGNDNYVRVYDKRSIKEPVNAMCPEHVLEAHSPNVTCCVYNNTGTEILASYSEENIYLFSNSCYVPGEYLHCYKGHYNQKTIKGVNFFGPNCEYVISGSDCGNIFYWDKNTEAILNFMPGDTAGVVNCLEPHPRTPILATSGLDHNIKIWTPSASTYPPDLTKLPQCVRRNLRRTALDDGLEFDDSQLQYFIRQILRQGRRNDRERNLTNTLSAYQSTISDVSDGDDSDDGSSYIDYQTDNDEDFDEDDEDVSNLQRINCGTQ